MSEFPPMTDEEVETCAAKPGASRLADFMRTVAASGMLCAWGDDEDTEYMEDSSGREVIPVWSHPALAVREFGPEGSDGGPIPVSLDRFIDVWLPQLTESDYGIAIHPVGEKIAVTLTPAEFESKVRAEQRRNA